MKIIRPIESVLEWLRQSVRRQIVCATALMLSLASIAATTIAVMNGRAAVETEMKSSIAVAEKYLRAVVERWVSEQQEGRILEDVLARQIVPLRHAELHIIRDGDLPRLISPSDTLDAHEDEQISAPKWFAAIMQPRSNQSFRRFIYSRDTRASFLIVGHADDEVNEKWHELSALAAIWLAVIAILLFGLDLILRRILEPLVSLSTALSALEIGERQKRLPVPRVQELADIALKFNTLAQSLDQTRDENGALYQQMMSIQEEERRVIASELHDEAGPCLFGITANTESIERLAGRLPEGESLQFRKRTSEILSVTERLKSMNRSLLRRLRPLSLGKVPVAALLNDLIIDFERLHPDVHFIASIETSEHSYGERVDLTVYRCLQESLTNAIRHGRSSTCIVTLSEALRANDPDAMLITLSVRDNGAGLQPDMQAGFGLAAMRERVLAVGGTWSVSPNWPNGTSVSVSIPASSSLQPMPGAHQRSELIQ